MIRVLQHHHKCIGCNACVEVDPFRWRITQNTGKCILIGGRYKKGWYFTEVGNDELQEIQAAARHCPVNIIKYEKV